MLSVVIPGQKIVEHDDIQDENWIVRVHIPLITNPKSIMFFGQYGVNMPVGSAYLINTEVMHSLENMGSEPRIHFFFDLKK
jgi:hypothetical protein